MEEKKGLCIDYKEWTEHRRELQDTARKVDDMRATLNKTLGHMEHLVKLDVIAEAITEMKNTLIEAVVGKDHVPTKTHDIMFSQLAKANSFNYKILSAVIIGLLGIIVFLLTGQTAGLIPPLH